MQFDWMSMACGFLGGAAVGAAGMYYAEKFTDQRRHGERIKEAKKQFLKIKKQMPELIAEMKSDLSNEDNCLIREFFILSNRRFRPNSQKPRFAYYEDEHKDLRSKIDILENHGFLMDVTPGNTSIYRMSEELVELILKHG